MLHTKQEYSRLDAPFAEKRKDIDNGDIVEILSEGQSQPNRFDQKNDQTVIKIKTKNGARWINLNPKSANILIDEFKSNDDKDWIGKPAKVLLHPTVIGGKKVKIAYLVGAAWELDEYGEPVNPGAQPAPPEDDFLPPEEGEVSLDDIPNF
jgi:hypothetical protein